MANKKTITRADENFLINHINPQLKKERQTEIELPIGNEIRKFNLTYCTLKPTISSRGTIVLLTGWGSGWTGIALLGIELCKLGYKVVMLSMLGYGNSDNPPYWDKYNFLTEAEVFMKWMNKALPNEQINLVGHSMGPIIQTEVAAISSRVASLTLLDPVGFHNRSLVEMMIRFGWNGFLHSLAFAGDPKQKIIEQLLPVQKSPFTKDRRKLRLSEAQRLCSNYALNSLKLVANRIPINCIYGEWDSVCSKFKIDCSSINYRILPGLYHNTTRYGCEKVAKTIDLLIPD